MRLPGKMAYLSPSGPEAELATQFEKLSGVTLQRWVSLWILRVSINLPCT
jgi:hypothetical protein